MANRVSPVLCILALLLLTVLVACNLTSVPAQPERGTSLPVSTQTQRTQQRFSSVAAPLVTTTPLPAPVVSHTPADTARPTLLPESDEPDAASATPGFEVNVEGGPAPLAVQFSPRSRDGELVYRWDFGDGVVSEEANPQHSFETPGNYVVTLTISGVDGVASYSRRLTVEMPVIPEPIAALVANPRRGVVPLTVCFDSSDSSGLIDNHDWDFGDGVRANGIHVEHSFEQAGSYAVTLRVSGPGGQSSREAKIEVLPPPTQNGATQQHG